MDKLIKQAHLPLLVKEVEQAADNMSQSMDLTWKKM